MGVRRRWGGGRRGGGGGAPGQTGGEGGAAGAHPQAGLCTSNPCVPGSAPPNRLPDAPPRPLQPRALHPTSSQPRADPPGAAAAVPSSLWLNSKRKSKSNSWSSSSPVMSGPTRPGQSAGSGVTARRGRGPGSGSGPGSGLGVAVGCKGRVWGRVGLGLGPGSGAQSPGRVGSPATGTCGRRPGSAAPCTRPRVPVT